MMVSHPLQSEAWGEFRRAMGIDVVRVNDPPARLVSAERAGGAGWQLTFHKIPFTPFTVGYFPKGPKITKEMLEILEKLGKEKNAIFIQIEPNVRSNLQPTTYNLQPLVPSHHPLFTKYTFVLDLTKSEEELLKTMQPKTRYNLKVAQKHGVVIANDDSPQAFSEYLRLTRETTERQGFYAHNQSYHRRMWDTLHPAGVAKLFTATYQKTILAAWIIFVWNKTIYYPYGASSRQHREVMAPTLLLWEIARWGKRQGYQSFDLWGALGPHPDEHDPWYGFHRFKQGFNPKFVEFVGSFDLILNPVLYRMYTLADRVRWKILK